MKLTNKTSRVLEIEIISKMINDDVDSGTFELKQNETTEINTEAFEFIEIRDKRK